MQTVIAASIFFLSAVYVFIIYYLALSPLSLLRALVLPMILLLIVLYLSSASSWKQFLTHRGKWFILFWGTAFVQLLVLSTGGLSSPFLILIHLFMIGLSFIFSFSVSLLFLLSSFSVIFITIVSNPSTMAFFIEHPNILILQVAAVIPIVAVAYIVSQQYHLKDILFGLLRTKVTTDEAIIERLHELIIVTDPNFNILSVNDAVERTFQKSRSELLSLPLFSVILLKDKNGKLVDQKRFFFDGKFQGAHQAVSEAFTLVNSPTKQKKMILQVQPIEDAEEKVSQISFILSDAQQFVGENTLAISIERARAKYEAMIANIKNTLRTDNNSEVRSQIIMMENIERDIYHVQSLKPTDKTTYAHIDVAQLCKQTVLLEKDFAQIFQVPVTFSIQNFAWKEIAPLTVKDYTVVPEKLTGPFFTVTSDVKQLGLIIKKVLDFVILLASTESNAKVTVSVEQEGKKTVVIKITGNTRIPEEELADMYVPYYGKLSTKTNLQAGSGLEGYLIKKLSESLGIPVEVQRKDDTAIETSFVLRLKKTATLGNN